MDARRLDELLDAYGADPARWPADERAAAEALLASSPELRARVTAAAQLDALLDVMPAVSEPSAALRERVLASATPPPVSAMRSPARRSPVRYLVAAALPLAAGVLLWLARSPEPEPRVAAAPRRMNVVKAAVVEWPTDDLLSLSGGQSAGLATNVLDAVPTIGCSAGSGLGCPDLDVLPEAQSRDTSRAGRLTA